MINGGTYSILARYSSLFSSLHWRNFFQYRIAHHRCYVTIHRLFSTTFDLEPFSFIKGIKNRQILTGRSNEIQTFFSFFVNTKDIALYKRKKKLVDRDLTFPCLSFSCDFLCPPHRIRSKEDDVISRGSNQRRWFVRPCPRSYIHKYILPVKAFQWIFQWDNLPRKPSICDAFNDPSSEHWRARVEGGRGRREKGLCACLFRAKKSLKRRGTVGSAAANPHNGRIVRNGSTNLRVIYVLITGLQRGRARFAHVRFFHCFQPRIMVVMVERRTHTRVLPVYRPETLLEFSPQSSPFLFLASSSPFLYLQFKVIISVERKRERKRFEIAYKLNLIATWIGTGD